ncbi:MAG TPA: PIN domain-containing protein [Usitatibacter sp.]|nr:PIN domain-containing protein [Usitatibacter sp.]
MDALGLESLAEGALVLVDTAPIIYVLEGHAQLAARFAPLFARHEEGTLHLAVSTVTLSEVLAGPLAAGEEAIARRYRATLESWGVVNLTADIAEQAARARAQYRLKLPDAIQLATALAINADALATHDRAFGKVRGLRILA